MRAFGEAVLEPTRAAPKRKTKKRRRGGRPLLSDAQSAEAGCPRGRGETRPRAREHAQGPRPGRPARPRPPCAAPRSGCVGLLIQPSNAVMNARERASSESKRPSGSPHVAGVIDDFRARHRRVERVLGEPGLSSAHDAADRQDVLVEAQVEGRHETLGPALVGELGVREGDPDSATCCPKNRSSHWMRARRKAALHALVGGEPRSAPEAVPFTSTPTWLRSGKRRARSTANRPWPQPSSRLAPVAEVIRRPAPARNRPREIGSCTHPAGVLRPAPRLLRLRIGGTRIQMEREAQAPAWRGPGFRADPGIREFSGGDEPERPTAPLPGAVATPPMPKSTFALRQGQAHTNEPRPVRWANRPRRVTKMGVPGPAQRTAPVADPGSEDRRDREEAVSPLLSSTPSLSLTRTTSPFDRTPSPRASRRRGR